MLMLQRWRHFGIFSIVDKCRSEVADDVISGEVVDKGGTYVLVKYGDSTVTELLDSLAGRTRFTHFCEVFNCILRQNGNS